MRRTKRRLGQHFLTDPRLLGRIADALGATRDDTVLEIGPGPGGLTAALVERAGRLVAIEKDRELVPELRARFPDVDDRGGRRARDRLACARRRAFLVAGNIPYNITSPLIDKALEPPRPGRIVFLVQLEVAERVVAAAGDAGVRRARRVGVQAVARAERLFTVPAGRIPSAAQGGLGGPPADAARGAAGIGGGAAPRSGGWWSGLFGFRRKQVLRGLRELTGWEAAQGRGACWRRSGVAPVLRPEVLAPETFARLLRALVDGGWHAT